MELADLKRYAGKRVCVAVSGGVDSVCLLHCFLRAAETHRIALSALTCEHGIRGERSVADRVFVEKLCRKWQIPLSLFSEDVPARAKESGKGIEEAGRDFRYRCFAEILKDGQADVVATAHHRDDFAETALFRLARGTSLAGLASIRERDGIVRPFLSVNRAEIERYAEENGLEYVADESNADESYARNAIRNSVLPALDRAVNGASKHIAEFAFRAKEDDDLLQSLACKEVIGQGDLFRIPADLVPPLFSRACLFAVKSLGCEKDYTSANLRDIAGLKTLQSGRAVNLPSGIVASREGGFVVIYRPKSAERAIPFCTGAFQWNGRAYSVSETASAGALRADAAAFPSGAIVRTRREGDVFTPYKGKRKSLKEYLTDKKISARAGRELPLVAKDDSVYAIFGVEISDAVKVTEQTERIVYLACEK